MALDTQNIAKANLNPSQLYILDGSNALVPATQAMLGGGAGLTDTQLRATPVPITGPSRNEYEFVAASQTNQVLGAGAGAIGDYCEHLLVIPLTTSPGNVQLKDGAGTAMTVFAGGASSVTSLVPFNIYVGAASVAGAWQVTTGANVQVIAAGNYT